MSGWLRLPLVTLSVGGGFTGAALTSQAMLASQDARSAAIALYAVFGLLYIFVLVAGLMLVHDPRRTTAVVVALALQAPVISSPVIGYRFGAGLVAPVGISQKGFYWLLRLGADWQCNLGQRLPWGVGVNLVPVLALLLLLVFQSGRGARHG